MSPKYPPIEWDPIIRRKIDRIASGAPPRVIDLFAGCGGISLGFNRAGFDILAALEIDPLAARSHAMNFYKGEEKELTELHAKPQDITAVEPDEFIAEFSLGETEAAADVLVGGPPCQAYARVGRAKLREIAEHPTAYKIDPRGNLYLRYLAFVKSLKPLAIMIENVPDILHYGGHNVIQEIVESLEVLGYEARYSLINSAFHGVPQMRDRVFLLAYRCELRARISFPKASHHMSLPSGYDGTRAVALKYVDLFGGGYVAPDLGTPDLPFPITAQQALADLPKITQHIEGKLKRGPRRFSELAPYDEATGPSTFAVEMRNWPRFESSEGVWDHVIRSLPRDTDIFRAMEPGTEYPAAHKVAVRLFELRAHELGIREDQEEYTALRRKMVPPYPVETFPNRWWKLKADFPVRTLMAHIGKDTYSHIHYDDNQARVISVREAARLQSFPDGFVFSGTMNPAFRQIGNAVPPLMAFQIALEVRETLQNAAAMARAVEAAE